MEQEQKERNVNVIMEHSLNYVPKGLKYEQQILAPCILLRKESFYILLWK